MKKITLLLLVILLFNGINSQVSLASERAESLEYDQQTVYSQKVAVVKTYTSLSIAPNSIIYNYNQYKGTIYKTSSHFNDTSKLWSVFYTGTVYCSSSCPLPN